MAITAAGVLAALALVAAEFSTVASVEVAGDSCQVISDSEPELAERCDLSGLERNGGAFLVLAALVLATAWGAGVGASRPAAVALVAVGLLVLAWALLADLPVTRETGAIGRSFEGATGPAGPGLALEIAAGALALAAGAAGLARLRLH